MSFSDPSRASSKPSMRRVFSLASRLSLLTPAHFLRKHQPEVRLRRGPVSRIENGAGVDGAPVARGARDELPEPSAEAGTGYASAVDLKGLKSLNNLKSLTRAALLVALVVLYMSEPNQPDGPKPRQSLTDDPLASYQPAQGRLVKVREYEDRTPTTRTLSVRMFALPAGDAPVQLEQVVTAARAAGWRITAVDHEPMPFGALVATGEKTLTDSRAQLGIALFVDDTLLGAEIKPPALQISLEQIAKRSGTYAGTQPRAPR